jgi:hypothetical protein
MARTRPTDRPDTWDQGGWADPWAGTDGIGVDDEAFARAIAEGRRAERAA